MDVDFLMRGPNNDLARMDEIIVEILTVDTGNDFVAFKKVQGNPHRISCTGSSRRRNLKSGTRRP